MHGHRYEVVACASKDDLNEIGLAFDFTRLKRSLDEVLEGLDHRNLNETAPFDEMNPSAENLARFIYESLHATLPDLSLDYVQTYESPDAWATYRPD
jgi:6-pyruvoyltetrahydropterin/6-carboxytetrahydropterin synthase